ncbi:MAG: glycosyltransferase family 4 protein [Chloroflexi bacterium]|nr:glycosyltransferase family 4 protein [Chloroflexota bacterium]
MVGPFGLKPKGTMAVRALPLAKVLKERGHCVALFLPPWSYPQDAGRVYDEEGVRVENVAVAPRAQIPLRLVSRVRAFQPEVVHVFKPKAYAGVTQWLLWQMRRVGLTKARLVLDTDDWEGAGGWNDLEAYSWVQKKFFAWQEQWGLTHADAVTVASRALETIVWSLGAPRARVMYVPNGVNSLPPRGESRHAVRVELGLENAPTLLLYTRFFEYDLARLAETITRVLTPLPNAKLLLVGKGLFGEETQFLEMARVRGWRERVVNAGWVEMARLRGLFAAGDVALYPFDDTLVNRCKCPVKLIDLLAAGVPVVGEAVGQIREYISDGETGLLVAPGDVDEFARRVIDLLGDAETRARLGAGAAAAMARDYAWENLAERVERAYLTPP